MNSKRIQLFLIFVLCFLLVNQVFPQADKKDAKNTAGKMPGIEQQTHTGTVIQTFDSGGYTYLEFMENKKKLWAAALKFRVKAGDKISFSQAAPMGNFYSKTLKRTFKTILFVGQVRVLNAGRTEIKKKIPGFSHPEVKRGKKKKYKLKPGSIPKAKEGYTVEECFLNRDKLKGKIISIRGMVVKFTARILGKNWLHLQDGTGEKGTGDLTVTTKDKASPGDIILVTGKLYLNKDFGSGYKYPLIIEEAVLKIENKKTDHLQNKKQSGKLIKEEKDKNGKDG